MKTYGVLLLAALAYAGPISKKSHKIIIDEDYFPDSLAIYTSQHDIVNIFVPLNALNFQDDTDDSNDDDDASAIIFFIEADTKENGDIENKGLSVLKNGKVTKLLADGRDSAAANDDTKNVYFAANDGIYLYNAERNIAEKYGSISDSIINIAKENGTDVIYILTENKELYKVTDDGEKKVKIDDVKDAQQIMLDYSNNLYYYGPDKIPYVKSADGIKKIEGLPENPTQIILLRPPFVIERGIPVIIDKKGYEIFANGSSHIADFEFRVKPTAYSMEATLIQYYAYNKKIYEYNILALILSNVLEKLSNYLEDKKDSIQSIATRSRSDLRDF